MLPRILTALAVALLGPDWRTSIGGYGAAGTLWLATCANLLPTRWVPWVTGICVALAVIGRMVDTTKVPPLNAERDKSTSAQAQGGQSNG